MCVVNMCLKERCEYIDCMVCQWNNAEGEWMNMRGGKMMDGD